MTLDLSYLSIILQSLVVAVVIVLAVFAWRWLRVALERGLLGAQNEALAQIMVYARIFVAAAEQTLGKQPGPAKLDWVLNQFDDVLPGVDKNLIRSFVEAAVSGLPTSTPTTAAQSSQPPTATTTTTTTAPPTPADCDPLAPLEYSQAPVTSHSHKDRGKPKAAQTV